ncbi:MAG: hypothetical protein D6775_02180 [Caldilineae bacterium]|nr:MAG: hypothetical protein D6775_02180 [Caldilineae bacterium]
MTESLIIGLATIIFTGIIAQWLAWRLHIPSILLLLIFGFALGPATGLLDPDEMFGDLLFPFISLAVGIILFEGGLGLRLSELATIGRVVRNLISVGALVTGAVAAVAAALLLNLQPSLAVLLGAILIVSGPTVILPLLRDIRPIGQVGSILRWEGIVIDPIGATLALLVFDALLAANVREASGQAFIALLQIVIIGAATGWAGARLLALMLRRFLIPDHLQNAFTLMLVIAIFALSNTLATESGLLATTVMGMVLANQRSLQLKRIVEFKEDLGVVITSSLFVLLAARLEFAQLLGLGWPGLVFLAVLILIARPLMVYLSTLGSTLQRNERLFLAWMAPRGIVAAAVASIFALELSHQGFADAERLVPITFLVIIGTVMVYGLTAGPMARRLGLAESDPQGLLFIGAHDWARALARFLQEEGVKVVLVDTNPRHVFMARNEGLNAVQGNILYEEVVEEMDLGGIGRALALTSNDEVNALAVLHLADVFGRSHVYQLPLRRGPADALPSYLVGRVLFDEDAGFRVLSERFGQGWSLCKVTLSHAFDYDAFVEACRDYALPMFVLENGRLRILSTDQDYTPQPDQTLVALVAPGHTLAEPKETPEETSQPALPDRNT